MNSSEVPLDDEIKDILKTFENNILETELDISSCSLSEIPLELFSSELHRIEVLILDYNELNDLPEDFNNLVNLTTLSLIGNNLHHLPETFCVLENLEKLILNENDLCKLPSRLGSLKKLQVLNLAGNKLSTLPDSCANLVCLEELYLDDNELTYMVDDASQLQNVRILECSNNKLVELPTNLGSMKNLEVLTLNSNQINFLPETFSHLSNIKMLDISNNKIKELPSSFASCQIVERLYLENNALEFLPDWFSNMTNVLELSVANNSLVHEPFSDNFCKSSLSLKKIEAGANFMSSISTLFGNLTSLEYIHFGSTISELERSNFQNGNWLKEIPSSFCMLINLKKANLNENQIQELPDNFGNLVSLEWLDLGQNMLKDLPTSFTNLKNLEYLQLSKNLLQLIPGDFGKLSKLIDLRLDNNHLKDLPDSFEDINNLQSLDLFNNDLAQIPKCIYKLKNLKRLDLDENKLNMRYEDTPKITPINNYAPRDPNLKDNWRGKTRPDKEKCDTIKIEIDNPSEEEEKEEELAYNESALERAMMRGLSMWRSHSAGASTREIYNRALQKLRMPSQSEDNDDEWVALNYSIGGKTSRTYKNDETVNSDEEDWDKEIEEYEKENQAVNDSSHGINYTNSSSLDSFQTLLAKYPPAAEAFSKTAFYDSFVCRKLERNRYKEPLEVKRTQSKHVSQYCVIGQFDDVEE